MFNSPADFQKLYQLLDYRFNNAHLLAQALTRKSGLLEGKQEKHIGHNERLEFLGDSMLRAVIDDIIFELYPEYDEEQLSNIRDQWVAKDRFLYTTAEKINLEPFVIMGNGESANCQGSGRKKILADTMEAIIGAVFLDSNHHYPTIKQFIGQHSGLQLLLQANRNKQLFEAVKNSNLIQVKYWLKQGANPNALHLFTYSISFPCYLEKELPMWLEGNNVAKQSNALDLAIRRIDGFTEDSLSIVKALLKYGAKPNQKGSFSHSVLHETIIYYPKSWEGYYTVFTELIPLLCDYGADPNGRDIAISCINNQTCDFGYTPLELAIMRASAEKVEALLTCGADPNLTNHKGQTALHLACIYYELYTEQERQLAEMFDFYTYSQKDYLPIFKQIIKNLLQFEANPMQLDKNSRRPADHTHVMSIKKLLTPLKYFSTHDNALNDNSHSRAHHSTFFYPVDEEAKAEQDHNTEQAYENTMCLII